MDTLPPELLQQIAVRCELVDLINLSLLNHQWLAIARENYCWWHIFKRYDSSLYPGVCTLDEAQRDEYRKIIALEYEGSYRERFYHLVGVLLNQGRSMYRKFYETGKDNTLLTRCKACWTPLLPIFVSFDSHRYIAILNLNLGAVCHALGELGPSMTFLQQALEYSRTYEFKDTEIAALCNLGVVSYTLGEHQQAARYAAEGLRLADCIGHATYVRDAIKTLERLPRQIWPSGTKELYSKHTSDGTGHT